MAFGAEIFCRSACAYSAQVYVALIKSTVLMYIFMAL